MSYVTTNGERRLDTSGSPAIADDRGVYRIYGLAPGDYVIGASWRPAYFGTDASELHLTTELDVRDALSSSPSSSAPAPRPIALASTFYPGTTVPREAASVTVRAGEEHRGIDFTLQIVPTARVEGILSWPGASAPPAALVMLITTGQVAFPGVPFEGYHATGIQPDGGFAFFDIAPGQYTVFARGKETTAAGTTRALWASSDIVVAGENVAGLNLLLAPGLTLSGQLRFDSTTLRPPADLKNVRVTLLPVQTGAPTLAPSGATVDAAGRFTMSGIIPGRYTLNVSFPGLGAPGGWALRSAIISGVDVLDAPFTAVPNGETAKAVVTFVDRMGQLTGTLQNAGGALMPEYSIVLFPTSSSLWLPQARRIQSVRLSADGAFVFRNLPAGKYYLAALEDVEPGAWSDPAFLQQLVPSSMKLAIGEGEHKVQDIRLGR